MIFEIYPAGIFQANCYIIGDEKSLEAVVVDPGGDANGIMNIIEKFNLNIKYIILTHGHGDHIGAVNEIKQRTSCSVMMSEKDEYLVKGETRNLIPILRNIKLFDIDSYIKENDILKIGDISIKVIETPGHTPGGLSFVINDIILSGDTLFQGSVGRTDFPGCSFEALLASIKNKLLAFDDNMKVFPGHGGQTTVGFEKKHNPFLR
jgi:glyoxylase-like metal-dependent hydrolase (beta-lactamase superfamily II)